MELNVGRELAVLKRLTVNELRERYATAFGEPTNARHKEWLVKRIIWRLQANAEGDLSERARQRAAELANDADVRSVAPKPKPAPAASERTRTTKLHIASDQRLPLPGSIITRDFRGEALQVKVLPDAFEYEGEVYKSLSAVAKHITGTHCNGYLFFRLNGGKA